MVFSTTDSSLHRKIAVMSALFPTLVFPLGITAVFSLSLFFLVCLFLVRREWVVLKRVWNSAPSTREILLMENAPCGSCYRTFPMPSEKQRAAGPEKQPGVHGAVACPSHDLHIFSTYLKNTQLHGGEEGRICLKASLYSSDSINTQTRKPHSLHVHMHTHTQNTTS